MDCQWWHYQGSNSGDNVTVQWGSNDLGYITLTQTNNTTGCSSSTFLTITINTFQRPVITGNSYYCVNNSYTFYSNASTKISNQWEVSSGLTIQGSSTGNSVIILTGNSSSGTITLVETNISSGCVDSTYSQININPLPVPTLAGLSKLCANNNTIYTANTGSNLAYKWNIANGYGSIIGSNSSSTVQVNWSVSGTDTLKLVETNRLTGCANSTSQIINIEPMPIVIIEGQVYARPGDTTQYSAKTSNGVTSNWTISGGVLVSGSLNDSTITILWGESGLGEITLIQSNSNGCKDSTILTVNIKSETDTNHKRSFEYLLGKYLYLCS